MESLNILSPIINAAMALLLALMPPWAAIACWSAFTAVLVMWLYRAVSPQQKITEMLREMKPLQQQMLSLQASPEEAGAATRQYLRLSLQRIGMTLVPVLLSSLPALGVWAALAAFYQQPDVSPQVLVLTPLWLGHWLSVYIFFSLLFSLALKIGLRIK
jgi:uncharacterized membrane protein (DUF106 family)